MSQHGDRLLTRAVLTVGLSALLLGSSTDREEGLKAFNEGRYTAALEKLKRAAASQPDTMAQTFLALTEAARGDCEAALPTLTRVNDGQDGDVYKLAQLAAVKCYSSKKNEGETFVLLDKLERRFPDDPDVLYLAAKLHMKAFNDATFAMFQRTPGSYRVHELSAEIFEVEGRYSEAVAEYRKAIEHNPAAIDLHFRLGRALLLQSHGTEALSQAADAFREELKVNPEDAASEFQLGQIQQVQGNGSEARLHFERALELSPKFVQALLALGKLETQRKDYARAIDLLNRAAVLEPSNATVRYALLTAYRDAGDMEKAKAEKAKLDEMQKPPAGEFSDFLRKLGEKPATQ